MFKRTQNVAIRRTKLKFLTRNALLIRLASLCRRELPDAIQIMLNPIGKLQSRYHSIRSLISSSRAVRAVPRVPSAWKISSTEANCFLILLVMGPLHRAHSDCPETAYGKRQGF